jgi:hypothetical protein
MSRPNDLSTSLVALDQNSTIIAVVELSHSSQARDKRQTSRRRVCGGADAVQNLDCQAIAHTPSLGQGSGE